MAIKPTKLDKVPHFGIASDIRLCLDEFYRYDERIIVEQIQSETDTRLSVPIEVACKAFRSKLSTTFIPSCYILCLSTHTDLDRDIDMPQEIKEKSLFHLYWPNKVASMYFKHRDKLFYGFTGNYRSRPYIAYAGMTEWIYMISGRLIITVIEPTKLNLMRYSAWDRSDTFRADPNTATTYTLEEGNFLTIPGGYITIRESPKTSYALGGEYLHRDYIPFQLEALEKDVEESDGAHRFEGDAEIRYLYWFFTAAQIEKKNTLPIGDTKTQDALKIHLAKWKDLCTEFQPKPRTHLNLYAPPGLNIHRILTYLWTGGNLIQ